MIYFYLVDNTSRNEPEAIKCVDYIHVKGRADGDQTIIISEENITSPGVSSLSKEEAQKTLNDWIDTENAEGNDITHDYISLDNYVF